MDEVGGTNEPPELKETGAANHAEGERAVVEISRGSLRQEGDLEFAGTVYIMEVRESARQRLDHRFHASDTGGKKVRIEEQFHWRHCRRSWLFLLRCTAASTALIQQSRNSCV